MCTHIRKLSQSGKIRRAMLLILGLMLFAIFMPGAALATETHYYVNPGAAVDGDGAQATPWNNLHSAVTYLNASGTGDVVLNLLAGVYSIDDGYEPDAVLTIEDNSDEMTSLHILGAGPDLSMFEGYTGAAWLDAIVVTGDNVTVEGLSITGYSGRGVYFNGAQNGGVVDCYMSSNDVGVEFNGCTNGSVTGDCSIIFNAQAGILLNESTYCDISGNVTYGISNNGDISNPFGIIITGSSGGGHTIHDNWINAGGDGYQVNQIFINGSATQDQIYGNIIQDSHSLQTTGVSIEDASPAIYGNIIKGCYYGVRCATNGAGSEASPVITNNLIYAASSSDMVSGIYFNGGNGGTMNPVIYHNTISTGAQSGIEFSNFEGSADVQYNILDQFLTPPSYGVVLNSGSGTIYADYNITHEVTYSFYGFLQEANNMFYDPSFSNYAGEDFSLAGSSPCIDFIPAGNSDPVVEDIEGTARPAGAGYDAGAYEYTPPPPTLYYVNPYASAGGDGSEATPWNSISEAFIQIESNAGISGAVELHLAAAPYSVNGNGGTETDAAHMLSSGYFDHLTIIGAGSDSTLISGVGASSWPNGLQIQAANVTVANLTVENFSGSGVKFEDASNGAVKTCVLKNNSYGIEISGGQEHQIMGCDIFHNTHEGVDVRNSGMVDIFQNRIFDNGGAVAPGVGVFVTNASYGGSTIAENEVYCTGDASYQQLTGIFNGFNSSSVDVITGNVITSTVETAATEGVHISNASPDVDGNRIFDCTTGIFVENPQGSTTLPLIKNNVIAALTSGTYKLENGIALYESGGTYAPVIFHNTLYGGSGSGIYIPFLGSDTTVFSFNIIMGFSGYGINVEDPDSYTAYADYNVLSNNGSGQLNQVMDMGNNISDAQPFFDRANGDFRLSLGASAIDAIPAVITNTVAMDARGLSRPQNIDWDIGAYEMDQTNPTNPTLDDSDPAAGCTLDSSLVLTWTVGVDNESGIAGYYWVQDDVSDTDPMAGSPFFTELPPDSLTLNSGDNYLHIIAEDMDGNLAGSILHLGPWNYDTTPPDNPVLLSTSVMTDTCVQTTTTELIWDPVIDDCGMYGYFYYVDSNPAGAVTTSDSYSYDPPASITLNAGTNYLHIRAKDGSHMLAVETLTIGPWYVDDALPVNPVLDSALPITNTCITDEYVSFTWASSGSDDCGTVRYRWCIDASPDTDPGAVITAVVQTSLPTIFTLGYGTNYIHMVAQDDFSSASEVLHFGPWKKDFEAPTQPSLDDSLVPVGTCIISETTTLTWTEATDDCGAIAGYYWTHDQSASTTPTPGTPTALPSELTFYNGDNYLHVQAVDSVGNVSGVLHLGPWKKDYEAPSQPSLDDNPLFPVGTCIISETTTLTWTEATDDCGAIAGYYWTHDQSASTTPTPGTPTALPSELTFYNGDNYLHVQAVDSVGNVSGVLHLGPWKKDYEPPVNPQMTSCCQPISTCLNSTYISLSWSEGADDCGIDGYYWYVDAVSDTDPSLEGNYGSLPASFNLEVGDNYLHVIAKDSAGRLASESLHLGPWIRDGALPVNPELTDSDVASGTCTMEMTAGLTWTEGSDDCGLEGYYVVIDNTADTDPLTGGVSGALPETLDITPGADTYIHVQAKDMAGKTAASALHIGPWKSDIDAPENPSLVSASVPTDTCTLETEAVLTWTAGFDDCGIEGYYWSVDLLPDSDPTSENFGELPITITLSSPETYLHVQTLDASGQLANDILHIGPWKNDITPPPNPDIASESHHPLRLSERHRHYHDLDPQ